MSEPLELDDLESYDEADDEMMEFDENDEFNLAEARRRRARRQRPPVASGRGLYQPRPTSNHVTQAQLQAAMNRVGAQVKTNSQAIAAVSARVGAISDQQQKQAVALKKEAAALRKDIRQTRELAALMPLLTQPSSIALKESVDSLPAGTKVMVDKGSGMSMMLPLLLMGGLGGNTSGDSGMDSNMILMLALAMGLGK